MDKFVLLKGEEKKAYFEAASAALNIMPQLIEKDFWVCWVLKILFSLPDIGAHLTFKGGTSLSKCFNLIKRFSEDIDISIERAFLSGSRVLEPGSGKSNKENQKRLKELQTICGTKIEKDIVPALNKAIAAVLTNKAGWKIELDPEDADGQTVLFVFPRADKRDSKSYIRPSVKIEFGARADHWPVETAKITPYVAKAAGSFLINAATVRVLAAERTFWEKATILHMIYHYPDEKILPLRMSRHYYDIYEMANSAVLNRSMENISLLKQVAEHKILFFKANWAHYEEAIPGTLRLLPRDDQISLLKNDYRQMQQMFFGEFPSFDKIMERLRAIEEKINAV
jgi:hypothetical protein